MTASKRQYHMLAVQMPLDDYYKVKLLAIAASSQSGQPVTVSDIVRCKLRELNGIAYANAAEGLKSILQGKGE